MFLTWMYSPICETNIYLILLGYFAFLFPLIFLIILITLFVKRQKKIKKKSSEKLIVKILLTIWISATLCGVLLKTYDIISNRINSNTWPRPEWCGFRQVK